MKRDDSQKCYMLDTNILDSLAKGRLTVDELPSDGKLWVTPVQLEELKNAVDVNLRSILLETVSEIVNHHGAMIPAAFALDIAGAGFSEGEWRSDGALWCALKKDLDEAWEKKSKKEKKNSRKENNLIDSSIAEAAKFNGCALLTSDGDLARVAAKHGIKVQFIPRRKRLWIHSVW